MQSIEPHASPAIGTSTDARLFWRRLLFRWFVEYNPAYLLSAAFVFGGCFLWSRGVVHEATTFSTLGIPLVAELYAAALIGGAALLTRLHQRRPAVLLTLIFVVYQWDTTLHTEACAYLGSTGAWATLTWLMLFFGKLRAIGWALRIRIAPRMRAALVIAAVGLAVFPYALRFLDARAAGSLLAAWGFALASLHRNGEISSSDELDAWGFTVLRRTTHAVWTISAAMIALHVFMWCANVDLTLAPLLFSVPLLAIRRMRSELRTWALILSTFVLAAMFAPGAFFATTILSAGALLLRIFAPQFPSVAIARDASAERVPFPYRASGNAPTPPHATIERTPTAPLDAGEIARAWAGALFAIYLGAWTLRWSSGAWPAHVVWLDVAFSFVTAFAAWRSKARATFGLPLALTYADFVIRARLVSLPQSSTGLGELGVALGFALLGVSLFVSYRLREFAPTKSRLDSA